MNSSEPAHFPQARRSASAEASRAAEQQRLRGMTVEERIVEALSLEKRFQSLLPETQKKQPADGSGI